MLLLPPPSPATQVYTVKVETADVFGNLVHVNTRQTTYRKQPLQRAAQGRRYAVTGLDFTQTGERGLAQLDADPAPLRRELLMETDETGGLLRVCNKDALRREWETLWPALLHKYRHSEQISPDMIADIGMVLHGDGYLEDVLRQGCECGTPFPAPYGQPSGAAPAPGRPRAIPRFLGTPDRPLQTKTRRLAAVPSAVQVGLLVEGTADTDAYPAAAVREALRTLTDCYNLDTTLRMEHLESYEFDQNAERRHGARFTAYEVDSVFTSKTLCTLTAQAV